MKILGGKNPTLYSYEKSLPYLPVPDLDATTRRVIHYFRPNVMYIEFISGVPFNILPGNFNNYYFLASVLAVCEASS